jgi:hypothetical protein
MTAPTYGQPLIQPGDIVERIDALIPRGEDGTPLAWTRGYRSWPTFGTATLLAWSGILPSWRPSHE